MHGPARVPKSAAGPPNRPRFCRFGRVVVVALVCGLAALGMQVQSPPAFAALPNVAVRSVSGGYDHTCAVTASGTVRCWGANYYGQLGTGSKTGPQTCTGSFSCSTTPVAVGGLSAITQVAAGGNSTCALSASGTAKCWGQSAEGELGDGSYNAMSCYTDFCEPTPVAVSGLTNAIAISVGSGEACALLASRSVKCWGANDVGQLGTGSSTGPETCDENIACSTTPVSVASLTGVRQISVGGGFACALLLVGTVKCWGRNDFGNLGTGTPGTPASSASPVMVPNLSGVKALDLDNLVGACALLATGTVKCWGNNSNGELGSGSTTGPQTCAGSWPCSATPVSVVGLTNVKALSGPCALLANGTAKCWGDNTSGELGNGSFTGPQTCPFNGNPCSSTPVTVTGLGGAVAITAGSAVCAAGASGGLRCWGYNGYGNLGIGNYTGTLTCPVVSGGCSASPVSVQSFAALGGTVHGLGRNLDGELGDGTANATATPVTATGLTGAAGISSGFFHSVALLSTGTVKSWGDNDGGQLGTGSFGTNSSTPVAVSGLSNVIAIAAGANHTLALLGNGTVKAWGYNESGELGNGTTTPSASPVTVTGLTSVIAISAGSSFSLALLSNGTVKAWGYNHYGQLGNGTVVDSHTPVSVSGLAGTTAISAGEFSAMAITGTGGVKAWGDNTFGELGTGTTTASVTPVIVPALTNVAAVTAGDESHGLALLGSGIVKAWGTNAAGELGNGTTTNSFTPITVPGLVLVAAISAGTEDSLAVIANGSVKGWGYNGYGELGTLGAMPDQTTPVVVNGLGPTISIATRNTDTLAKS